ncbi:hypothetical protein F4778DRAFT_766032 [Xylariomycetidae sp. FL2044]|nr:hypothetical protein F4778DRAFT_766032 [Xylariomycetidae sp. FL2044]
MPQLNRIQKRSAAIFFVLLILVLLLHRQTLVPVPAIPGWSPAEADGGSGKKEVGPSPKEPAATHEHDPFEVELVVASTSKEDTSWLHRHVPAWRKNIYVVDQSAVSAAAASPLLTVPQNKGHETMVYLTYIIDHYDRLPSNVIFLHASRFAWHNDDPDYDGLPALQRFRVAHLREVGYVNLRCVWVIGCPAEIRPVADAAQFEADPGQTLMAKHIYKQAYEELLPDLLPVSEVVGVSCCSQFGVTSDTIRRRPREDYVRYRQWLLDTPLDDGLSGRVFEFSWHIIFGKDPVHCPSARDCFCQVYGRCDMQCGEDGCENWYILPQFSNLPDGWPLVGWDREERNFTGPLP